MIPTLLRNAATVAAVSFAVTFPFMDCSPKLWLADKLLTRKSLDDGYIWIVGASSGIGRELAYQLVSERKCQKLILSSRNTDQLGEIIRECYERADDPSYCDFRMVSIDVCETDSFERIVKDLPIDISTIFLNAGQGHLSPAIETSTATAERMYRTNTLWHMALVPLLLQKYDCLHLVVTSSIAGKVGVPLSATYAAAKFAVQGYYKSLLAEQGKRNLRVDLVCPGPVDTEFHKTRSSTTKSPLKLPVERTVSLMLRCFDLKGNQEVILAKQPTLTACYLERYFPSVYSRMMSRLGPKRVELYQEGYDIYDPSSWSRK